MRRSLPTSLGVAALLLLAACGNDVATPSPAAPSSTMPTGTSPSDTPATPAGQTVLEITSDLGQEPRTSRLTCDPPGGDHPDPTSACAMLTSGGADLFAVPRPDLMCTELYGGPQTATVTGTVEGDPVTATFDRTDGCQINRWDAVASILGGSGSAAPDSSTGRQQSSQQWCAT